MKEYYVYITTNPKKTTLYTGMTNDLQSRLRTHYQKSGNPETFAGKYFCYNLVYYDGFSTAYEAIQAEKYIKGKSRKWKENLIKSFNPSFAFLNKKVCGSWPPK